MPLEGVESRPYLPYPRRPPGDSQAARQTALVAWAKNCVWYLHPYRVRHVAFAALADLFQAGDQWPTPSALGYAGQALTYTRDPIYLGQGRPPMPVLNEYRDNMLNEAARLAKPDYEPTVRPAGTDPTYEARAGARTATLALRQALLDIDAAGIRRRVALHLPSYGGAWMMSWWDRSMEDATTVATGLEQTCPQCHAIYAEAPSDGRCTQCTMMDATDPESGETVQVEGAPQLEPFRPLPHELQAGAVDTLGRRMGQDVPMGQWRLEVPHPSQVFEAEFGVDADDNLVVRDVTIVRIRSLDWLRARWPNARSAMLRPESSEWLQRYHPIAGEQLTTSTHGLWRNHARLIERIQLPTMQPVIDEDGQPERAPDGSEVWEMNRGHYVAVASDVVLEESDLMVDGPQGQEPFPRVLVTYTCHDLASGGTERLGNSLSRLLLDPQRSVNLSASMALDEQEAGASCWLAHEGTNLSFDQSGGAQAVRRWSHPESADPNVYKPELVARPTGADFKWREMIDYMRSFMGSATRRTEVEGGTIPGPTTAASALQIAREESGELRRPRVAAISASLRRHYVHALQCLQRWVREPRVAWDRSDSGRDVQRWWQGSDFAGQTDVQIDVEGAADSELLRVQKLIDGIKNGAVDMNDPVERRIVGKRLGVPDEVYVRQNLQVAAAEREFARYTRDIDPRGGGASPKFGPAPVVDEGLDDDDIHDDRHGIDCMSDLWRQLEALARWDEALLIISGWPRRVAAMMAEPEQVLPGPAQAPGMPPAPATIVPKGLSALGPNIQTGLVMLWKTMLGEDVVGKALLQNPVLDGVMLFRAHKAAHRLRSTQRTMSGAAAAEPPAPGSSTATGG